MSENNSEQPSIELTDFQTSINLDEQENDKTKETFKSKLRIIFLRLKILINNNLMLLLILIAASLGLGLGFALRASNMDNQSKEYIGFPGELFVRALKFITMPLVFFNLITGMSGLRTRADKMTKIGLQTFLFYLVSLISSLLLGYLFVLTIKPGEFKYKLNMIINEI